MNIIPLERRAPVVVAAGAWLKNAACRAAFDVDAAPAVEWSAQHGDLSTPQACVALEASLAALLDAGPVDAIAHDLHPDFHSSRVAVALAQRLGVPAIAVQHHHAHVGVALAEHGRSAPAIGIALDGVGLGCDGTAWGGEILRVDGARFARVGHLQPLVLPGGDAAAREPWRMAAAALHAMKRGGEIVERFGPAVGDTSARGVATLLQRRLNCPVTTSAGRWFDAAAAALGLSVRQAHEAEAAIALERRAAAWLAQHDAPRHDPWVYVSDGVIDLRPLLSRLFELAHGGDDAAIGAGAALFHVVLADTLASAAGTAARAADCRRIVLAGGCLLNRVLRDRLQHALVERGFEVLVPDTSGVGDAGLALGQAWVGAQALREGRMPTLAAITGDHQENLRCA